jgi:hypothetical protein
MKKFEEMTSPLAILVRSTMEQRTDPDGMFGGKDGFLFQILGMRCGFG